jgi:CTP synthase (UTP-ammonia lyase)
MFQVKIAMVGKYTGLSDSYLSVLKVKLLINALVFASKISMILNLNFLDDN